PGTTDRGGRTGCLRRMISLTPTFLDGTAETYRADVVAAIGEAVEVLDSFVLGSGLVGGYRPGESDLDLAVVVDAPLRGGGGRQGVRGRIRRRRVLRLRRGRLHHGDDGLRGDRHGPELRRADRHLHGADGRKLRRRAGTLGIGGAARARGRDARGAWARLDG